MEGGGGEGGREGWLIRTLWVTLCWPQWVCVCVCLYVCMCVYVRVFCMCIGAHGCVDMCVRTGGHAHRPQYEFKKQHQDTCHNSNPTFTCDCFSNIQKPSNFATSLCLYFAENHSLTSSTRLWLEVSERPSRAENTLSRVSTSAALRSNRSLCSDRSFFHSSRLCWTDLEAVSATVGFFLLCLLYFQFLTFSAPSVICELSDATVCCTAKMAVSSLWLTWVELWFCLSASRRLGVRQQQQQQQQQQHQQQL